MRLSAHMYDAVWHFALCVLRVCLVEIRPFLKHLGLDSRQPQQLATLLGVDAAAIKQGLSRAQFAVVWQTMEEKQHTRLKVLANDIVARRSGVKPALAPQNTPCAEDE